MVRLRRPARAADRRDTGPVSRHEIDAYLAALDEPKRSTLEQLRKTILEVVPDAEQGLAYGMPAFKVRGKTVAGEQPPGARPRALLDLPPARIQHL